MPAKPPYPNWVPMLINETTLQNMSIVTGETPEQFTQTLVGACRENIPELSEQCYVLGMEGEKTVDDILPHVNPDTGNMSLYFIVIDTYFHYPVGILNVEITDPIENAVFTHNTVGTNVLACYITWTCSFTKSHKKIRGEKIKDYYRQKSINYQLSISKFITDYAGDLLLNILHDTVKGTDHIKNVLFYSIGIDGAREQHRKHGKLNACSFIEQWYNKYGQNIPVAYQSPPFSNTMFYFYNQDGQNFIETQLYSTFRNIGENISQTRGLPYGHPNYWKNDNYMCPGGPINDNTVRARYEALGIFEGGLRRKTGKAHFSSKRTRRRRRCTRRNK